MTADELLDQWLSGSTCFERKRTVFWEDGRFAILKHGGHSEWAGRWSPREWCPTFYSLYDLEDIPYICPFGRPDLCRVKGRWTRAARREMEKAIRARLKVDRNGHVFVGLAAAGWSK